MPRHGDRGACHVGRVSDRRAGGETRAYLSIARAVALPADTDRYPEPKIRNSEISNHACREQRRSEASRYQRSWDLPGRSVSSPIQHRRSEEHTSELQSRENL